MVLIMGWCRSGNPAWSIYFNRNPAVEPKRKIQEETPKKAFDLKSRRNKDEAQSPKEMEQETHNKNPQGNPRHKEAFQGSHPHGVKNNIAGGKELE